MNCGKCHTKISKGISHGSLILCDSCYDLVRRVSSERLKYFNDWSSFYKPKEPHLWLNDKELKVLNRMKGVKEDKTKKCEVAHLWLDVREVNAVLEADKIKRRISMKKCEVCGADQELLNLDDDSGMASYGCRKCTENDLTKALKEFAEIEKQEALAKEIVGIPSHLVDDASPRGKSQDKLNEAIEEAKGRGAGLKYDTGKLRYDLIPPQATKALAEVLTFGAEKYEANSWQLLEDAESRYMDALLRHIEAHRLGEHRDKESGLTHLAHALTNLNFLIYLNEES